jgi:hypothetical protein
VRYSPNLAVSFSLSTRRFRRESPGRERPPGRGCSANRPRAACASRESKAG